MCIEIRQQNRFPVVRPSTRGELYECSESTSSPSKAQTVLLVDDDEFSRDVMIGMLEELGISKIRTAVDGNDGLRVLKEMPEAPDVLICDILMPDMDGMSFLTELAKIKYQGRVALISGIDSDILSIAEKSCAMTAYKSSARS